MGSTTSKATKAKNKNQTKKNLKKQKPQIKKMQRAQLGVRSVDCSC